ncbi:odorant receptor 131-2-like [Anabas testudineus]|nr:odorant receptor 131-2-like [Anabas testudineus]
MLYANQSQNNINVGLVPFSILTTVTTCVFLYINGIMLFTLRSKPVFRETPSYILLYNLLLADTIHLAESQVMYMLAGCGIRLTYSVCGVLVMLATLTNDISPLILVVMSLERYVAVCYPLKHSTIITIRTTELAVIVVWIFSSLNILTRVLLLLNVSFAFNQMTDFCGKENMLLNPLSDVYDKVFTYLVFLSAGVTVTFSYIAVVVAARSVSANKALARKARNTLLLHVVQLGLSLSSTIHNPLLIAISKVLDRIVIVRIQIVFYVFIIIFPRCLSALIYGIRDQTIRPVLMYSLCCQWRRSALLSVVPAKGKVRTLH